MKCFLNHPFTLDFAILNDVKMKFNLNFMLLKLFASNRQNIIYLFHFFYKLDMSSYFIKILDSCPSRLKKKISTGPVIYKVRNTLYIFCIFLSMSNAYFQMYFLVFLSTNVHIFLLVEY